MADKIHFMGEDNRGPRGGLLYAFHCPGCGYGHSFEVDAPSGQGWSWNGSFDKPSFSPSLRCNGGLPNECHSWVTDGRIRFFDDCHHNLKGQTVDLPDWDS